MTEGYWRVVEPIWNQINIYDGPEIFLKTYSEVGLGAGHLYAAHFCQSEVCNGGFNQFFSNSTGVLAPEAVSGFRAIGQNKVADVVELAMQSLGSPYRRDRAERQAILGRLPADAFHELDAQFFELIETESGGFEVAANQYATIINGRSSD